MGGRHTGDVNTSECDGAGEGAHREMRTSLLYGAEDGASTADNGDMFHVATVMLRVW